MRKRGKCVYAKGEFRVYPVLETVEGGEDKIVGYVIVGPDGTSELIVDLDEAIEKANEMDRNYNPGPGF